MQANTLLSPVEILQLGKNRFNIALQQEGLSQNVVNDPTLDAMIEVGSTIAYNSLIELLQKTRSFIEDPLSHSATARTKRKVASPARGRITFNSSLVGAVMPLNTLIRGENNEFYNPDIVYESELVNYNITEIRSNGQGLITVTVDEDILKLASKIITNITGVADTDFNTNNVVITVDSLRTFTFVKTLPLKTSTGGVVSSTVLSAAITSQKFGSSVNLSGGSFVDIISNVSNIQLRGYVNWTNVRGGTDVESLGELSNRTSRVLNIEVTTMNDANMQKIVESFADVTRALVITSKIDRITRIYYMRDRATPPYPTAQDNENLLTYLQGRDDPQTSAIVTGRHVSDIQIIAPVKLGYTITFTTLLPALNNEEYKESIRSALNIYFKQLGFDERPSEILIRGTIGSQTKVALPSITGAQLDALNSGITIAYDTTVTDVVVAAVEEIIFP